MAVGGASIAQQDPQFTQYMFDRLSVNPAVAGISGELCGTLLLR
ncbi:MAG TPA: type IX secretion system membrane protein PorP/SprF, partial [Flavobacteriales bacterium]|nr:type IX secretion system membrane protein PorP/SprF [Flavobacteriales bacterium]